MSSLVGAKTALTPRGTPGLVSWRATAGTSFPRPYSVTFTQLRPGGLPGRRYGDFTKAVSTLVDVVVSDTANLSATEEPFDRQEIATTETARISASETTQLFNFLAATDTAGLTVSETISLVITGVTVKSASDTASISTTESVAIAVTAAVTDTASISTTDSATVAVSVDQKTVTDTASLTTDEAVLLNVFTGVVPIGVTDTAWLTTSETAAVLEVRRIRRITLQITTPHIDLEIL